MTSRLQQLADEFVQSKSLRCTPDTLGYYRNTLRIYINFVGAEHWPPTRQALISWLEFVARTASKTTVNTYWRGMQTFFNYLELVEAITPEENPARQIRKLGLAPERPELDPVAFLPEELERLFACLTEHTQAGSIKAIRDLALFRFAHVTGARSGEIVQLKLDCLNVQKGEAIILAETSKSKRKRVVYFDEAVKASLEAWLKVRGRTETKEVFVALNDTKGTPLKRSALNISLRNWSRVAGIRKRKFHSFRHTSAIDALEEGVPVYQVQKQLGHTNLATTMIYLRGRDPDRRLAYQNHSLSAGLSRRAEERRRNGC